MDSKRLEKHQERERQEDELLRSADERKRQREEKARRARKQAIQVRWLPGLGLDLAQGPISLMLCSLNLKFIAVVACAKFVDINGYAVFDGAMST